MLEAVIRAVLSNYPTTFFVLGLTAAAVGIARSAPPRGAALVVDALLRWYLFFSIGVGMFYNFVMHVFFGAMAARFIGWADSPFQTEVGLASLGFSVIGFLGYRGGMEARVAAVAGPACFLLGAGVGHLVDIARTHNLAPGSAGTILYTDFLLPVFGVALLLLAHRHPGEGR